MKDTIKFDRHAPNPAFPWLVTTDNGSRTWHSASRANADSELAGHHDRRNAQRRELARTMANQCLAIANGTVIGPERAAVYLLKENALTLEAWTEDDRS